MAGGERAPLPRPSRPRARAGPRARRVCAARHLLPIPESGARSGSSEGCRRRADVRARRASAGARGGCAHLGMAPRTSDSVRPPGVQASAGASEGALALSAYGEEGVSYLLLGPSAPWGLGQGPDPPLPYILLCQFTYSFLYSCILQTSLEVSLSNGHLLPQRSQFDALLPPPPHSVNFRRTSGSLPFPL